MVYRQDPRLCPGCQAPLAFREAAGRGFDGCAWCHGAFVEESVLEAMFGAKRGHLPSAFEPWGGKPRAILLCPVCQGAMAQVGLGHVPVDRCPSHGLWFARDELEEALRARPRSRAPREGHEERESGVPQIVAAVLELILYLF